MNIIGASLIADKHLNDINFTQLLIAVKLFFYYFWNVLNNRLAAVCFYLPDLTQIHSAYHHEIPLFAALTTDFPFCILFFLANALSDNL